MAKSPEQQIEECKILLENYEKHLCISFPHDPIALKQMEPQWKKEKEDIDEKCKEAVNELNLLIAQSSKKSSKIKAQARKMEEKYQQVSGRAIGITTEITDRLLMNSFDEWLRGSHEEMNDISQYYRHLQFFQDIKNRYEKVRKDTEERKEDYSTLQKGYQYHLTNKQQPSGIEPMTVASKKTSQEKNGEKEDAKREQGKATTEDEGEKGKEGENGTPDSSKQQDTDHDAEEYKEEFNQYQSKWNKVNQSWSSLKKKLDDFIAKKDPWEKIADLYDELNGHKEGIAERKTAIDDKGKKKTDNTSPRPVLEDYQQLAKEVSSDHNKQKLSELKDLVKAHITPKFLTSHVSVREFVTLTERLQDEWIQLSASIDDSIRHTTEKVDNWERKAGEYMRHTLEQQENGYAANQIEEPHHEGSGQREILLKCILGLVRSLIKFVFMTFLVLLVLLVCLDGHSWYLIFYHLQRGQLSFIELDECFADYS